MPEPADWSVTTFEGNRRRQHQLFHALPLREKIARIEDMNEIADFFAQRRTARPAPPDPGSRSGQPSPPEAGPG